MPRYKYIRLGHGISKEAEQAYNKLRRHEQSLREKDKAHRLMYYDHEKMFRIVDENTSSESLENSREEQLWEDRLKCLPYALEWLKQHYPDEHTLISEYYFSGKKKPPMKFLIKKYHITRQAIEKRLHKTENKLKNFINSHEYLCS